MGRISAIPFEHSYSLGAPPTGSYFCFDNANDTNLPTATKKISWITLVNLIKGATGANIVVAPDTSPLAPSIRFSQISTLGYSLNNGIDLADPASGYKSFYAGLDNIVYPIITPTQVLPLGGVTLNLPVAGGVWTVNGLVTGDINLNLPANPAIGQPFTVCGYIANSTFTAAQCRLKANTGQTMATTSSSASATFAQFNGYFSRTYRMTAGNVWVFDGL